MQPKTFTVRRAKRGQEVGPYVVVDTDDELTAEALTEAEAYAWVAIAHLEITFDGQLSPDAQALIETAWEKLDGKLGTPRAQKTRRNQLAKLNEKF